MAKEKVVSVVNELEGIDSEIALLTQKKGRLTSEYHKELLAYDLETISKVKTSLKNLKTAVALTSVEDNELLEVLEDVTSDIEKELNKVQEL